MSTNKSSRRRFIRTAAAGATGLALSSRASSNPSSHLITVSFEGLMAFHYRKDSEYEVGILNAPGHSFEIKKNGHLVSPLPAPELGKHWSLQVVNRYGIRRGIGTIDMGHDRERLQDDLPGQYDFSWIADFESEEFHADRLQNGELHMEPNKLQPIIRLTNGTLYTQYKIEKLLCKKGNNPYYEFGFMTETVGLDITLNLGESLVLKVENAVQVDRVFTVSYAEGPANIYFGNVPNTYKFSDKYTKSIDAPPSHFQHYYSLFSSYSIPAATHQYEIELKKPKELPRNPHPAHTGSRTVGDYPCGGIFLGSRESDLI